MGRNGANMRSTTVGGVAMARRWGAKTVRQGITARIVPRKRFARAQRGEDGVRNGRRGHLGCGDAVEDAPRGRNGVDGGCETVFAGATARGRDRGTGSGQRARRTGLREGRDCERDGTARGTGLREGRDCESFGMVLTLPLEWCASLCLPIRMREKNAVPSRFFSAPRKGGCISVSCSDAARFWPSRRDDRE